MIREHMKPAIISFLLLTFITGILYPLSVTGIAQVLFREWANGSLIYRDGNPIGSLLIGQHFDDPKYLWVAFHRHLPFDSMPHLLQVLIWDLQIPCLSMR